MRETSPPGETHDSGELRPPDRTRLSFRAVILYPPTLTSLLSHGVILQPELSHSRLVHVRGIVPPCLFYSCPRNTQANAKPCLKTPENNRTLP